MSKILKAIVIGAYCAVIVQFLDVVFNEKHETIIYLDYIVKTAAAVKRVNRDLKKFENFTSMHLNYKTPVRLPSDMKYILKYTTAFSHYTSSIYRNGQDAFIQSNCSYINCFLTNDKNLLIDPRNFDAIMFDVENNWDELPSLRSVHQKYIFTASESAANYPLCHSGFDSYFNWTWSYRLDSDIRWTYLTILDKKGNVVGPKINMTWIYPMNKTSEEVRKKLSHKKRLATWFASNCFTKNDRENVTKRLQDVLVKYGMKIDVYGYCGNLTCPKERMGDCLDLVERDYYFYLAFENSMCEDYVTEKILYPLQHYSVPIVYGGADYSRFLPPNSYIDAAKHSPEEIVSFMLESINDKETYIRYFEWHNHYVYEQVEDAADVCRLCKKLNEEGQQESVVSNFRKWWNPDYKRLCEQEVGGKIVRFWE